MKSIFSKFVASFIFGATLSLTTSAIEMFLDTPDDPAYSARATELFGDDLHYDGAGIGRELFRNAPKNINPVLLKTALLKYKEDPTLKIYLGSDRKWEVNFETYMVEVALQVLSQDNVEIKFNRSCFRYLPVGGRMHSCNYSIRPTPMKLSGEQYILPFKRTDVQ